jgi:predicted RNA binding protein YcfA (HicA-like mRNA interferase family)
MGKKQIVLSGKAFVKLLEQLGFIEVRVNGSHHRMKHNDGRVTTIPVHKNEDLPKGLMRKIIREDLKLEIDEFEKLVKEII